MENESGMKKESKRLKRRAVATVIFAAARGLEVSLDRLRDVIPQDETSNKEFQGALTEKEGRLLTQRYRAGRKSIEDIRKIAQHLWNTSKK